MSKFKVPSVVTFSGSGVAFAANDEDSKESRKFEMTAYTGNPVDAGFGVPFVVDVKGLKTTNKQPILRDHDIGQIVGYSQKVSKTTDTVTVSGIVLDNTHGQEVASYADQGFSWQSSIGFEINFQKLKLLDAGESETINGKDMSGPLLVAKDTKLRETSFVATGADDATTGVVLSAPDIEYRTFEMPNTNADPVAEFTASHGELIEQWKKEAADEARKQERARFSGLTDAFGKDRPQFVVEQFAAGNDVSSAKAALADVLTAELAAKDEQIETLKSGTGAEAASHQGQLDAKGQQTKTKPATLDDMQGLTAGQLAAKHWETNHDDCKDTFATVEGYERFIAEDMRLTSEQESK